MTFFVPGRLRNPLNGAHGHWRVTAKDRQRWRHATAAVFLSERESWNAACPCAARGTPKRVTFVAHTWNLMDSDGLQASLKSVRDALIDLGVIAGDGPMSGNEFTYAQIIDRTRRGVSVTVEPITDVEQALAWRAGD